MPNCDKCIWSTRSGNCVLWECKFVSYEDARRMIEEKERKDEKKVRAMMSLEQAIKHAEQVADSYKDTVPDCEPAQYHRQLAAWLRILKSAKFEYDEVWRIITHPTPDVTYADKDRAKIILNVFRDSLGRLEE